MKNGQALISVGIPCYNRPEGLAKAIESVLSQTHRNFELIISDNCSENPLVRKCALKYSSMDNRVKYFRQSSNIGAIANFKYLAGEAKSKYFIWLADDDYFYSESYLSDLLKKVGDNILCFGDLFSPSGDDSHMKASYLSCKTPKDYRLAWASSGSGEPIYGLFNLNILYENGIDLDFDDSIRYYNEGTFLHKVFLTGKVRFDDNACTYYNRSSVKPDVNVLLFDFYRHHLDVVSLYDNYKELPKNEIDSLKKIVFELHCEYLNDLFWLSSLECKFRILYRYPEVIKKIKPFRRFHF